MKIEEYNKAKVKVGDNVKVINRMSTFIGEVGEVTKVSEEPPDVCVRFNLGACGYWFDSDAVAVLEEGSNGLG